MIVKIINSTEKDSWYENAIGLQLEVFDMDDDEFLFADYFLPIWRRDVEIIYLEDGEKRKQEKKAIN